MMQIWKQELLNQAALIMDKNKVAREYEKKNRGFIQRKRTIEKGSWYSSKREGLVKGKAERLGLLGKSSKVTRTQPDKCSVSVRKQAELLEVTRTLVYY